MLRYKNAFKEKQKKNVRSLKNYEHLNFYSEHFQLKLYIKQINKPSFDLLA